MFDQHIFLSSFSRLKIALVTNMASSTHLSEYELTRQRNIERNMAFLKNIGLEASVNMRVQVSSNETNNQQVKASKQQKKLSETDGDNKILSNDLQDSSRRSTRIAAMNSIDYNVCSYISCILMFILTCSIEFI